jgi:hypothetical protein
MSHNLQGDKIFLEKQIQILDILSLFKCNYNSYKIIPIFNYTIYHCINYLFNKSLKSVKWLSSYFESFSMSVILNVTCNFQTATIKNVQIFFY